MSKTASFGCQIVSTAYNHAPQDPKMGSCGVTLYLGSSGLESEFDFCHTHVHDRC